MITAPHRAFRFAPTPSRWLHFGNALAAWLGWGTARAAGGRFILRIEDIDATRCRPQFEAAALADLAWLGLDWDEGPDVGGPHAPYRQSERLDLYDATLDRLATAGRAYPCACSRAEIRAAQSAPHARAAGGPGERPYPGTCRPARGAPAVALRADRGGYRFAAEALGDDAVIRWEDGLLGPGREDLRTTCGDFLLGRPGQPTYQLAVVVDDVAMGITDVVRGRDLVDSTARQIALHRALGRSPPRFAHHPLLVDHAGRKLSKRDAATALRTQREAGARPGPLLAALGRAVGLFAPTIRDARAHDLVDAFSDGAGAHLRDGALGAGDLEALDAGGPP